MGASAFRDDIRSLYERENHLRPFIGDAFASGSSDAVRVMTIGINAYLSESDWARQSPDWFSSWFKEGRHKFDRTVASDAATIANVLVRGTSYFAGLGYSGNENVFHTNAVKVYLPESSGKSSEQVTSQVYEAHVATWHAELDIMAMHGLLPHVILVFGRPFWKFAWHAFHPATRPTFAHLEVHAFQSASGDGHDFVNRGEFQGAAARHPFVMMSVRHPAARATSKATPDWLLSRRDVRELLGLG